MDIEKVKKALERLRARVDNGHCWIIGDAMPKLPEQRTLTHKRVGQMLNDFYEDIDEALAELEAEPEGEKYAESASQIRKEFNQDAYTPAPQSREGELKWENFYSDERKIDVIGKILKYGIFAFVDKDKDEFISASLFLPQYKGPGWISGQGSFKTRDDVESFLRIVYPIPAPDERVARLVEAGNLMAEKLKQIQADGEKHADELVRISLPLSSSIHLSSDELYAWDAALAALKDRGK